MVKRLRRNMDTMDDNTFSPAVHTVHIVHIVHSSLREQQLSIGDRLRSFFTQVFAASCWHDENVV
ncbi:MAG: hypothetical protein GX945_02630 [Lentisphaerae bacterium]|nr:hypothetical protein [Lentisphaerota bacterium]